MPIFVPASALARLKSDIKSGVVQSWDEVHAYYRDASENYENQRLRQAIASYEEVFGDGHWVRSLVTILEESVETLQWITNGIYESRAKDYHNGFRAMTYDSEDEMKSVVGKLEDNDFIRESREEYERFEKEVGEFRRIYSSTIPK